MTIKPVQESVPVTPASSTELRPFKGVLHWFEPRSQNRDERFRERTIRALVALVLSVMSLSLAVSIFVYRDPWAVFSFPTMHIVVLAFVGAAAYAVVRGKLDTAGWLVVFGSFAGVVLTHNVLGLSPAATSSSSHYISIPMFMFLPLAATVFLRRQSIFLISVAGVIFFTLSEAYLTTNSPMPRVVDLSSVISFAVLLMIEGLILRTVRYEFDSRFEALDEAIRLEALARQQAEADRRRAEEADRAKSQFLANMSHELRTPLNAIIGYSDILVGGMVGELPPQPTRLLNNIQSNSRRLLSLINDVLDLSKIEAGRLEVYNAPLQPRKLITDTVESLRALAIEKSIELNVSISDEVPEVILSDGRKLAQILTNLVSNAIKFTNKGGVDIDVTADSAHWYIVVRDTGSGMPTDALSYIFEPFRQVDSTDGRSHKGTGLGLAIVKALVESLQGQVEVTSQLNQGATFRVNLPRTNPTETGVVAAVTETNAAAGTIAH